MDIYLELPHFLNKFIKLVGNIHFLIYLTANLFGYDNHFGRIRLALFKAKDCVLHHADQTYLFSVQNLVFSRGHVLIVHIDDGDEQVQQENDIEDGTQSEDEKAVLVVVVKAENTVSARISNGGC